MRGKLTGVISAALAQGVAALLASALSPAAFAQTSAPQSRSPRSSPPSTSRPSAPAQTRDSQTPRMSEQAPRAGEADAQADLSITAHVTADSLRFEKTPNPRVEFTGRPRRETVWEAERVNLPEQVQPGVTYRNIGVTLRITSVFADIERIVAEALGEVPPSEDAQPAPAPPPGADNPHAPSSPSTEASPPFAQPRATSTLHATQTPATVGATPRRRLTHKGRVN